MPNQLIAIAGQMRSAIDRPANQQIGRSYGFLRAGLLAVLEAEPPTGRHRLALVRSDRALSDEETAVCQQAFGLGEADEPLRRTLAWRALVEDLGLAAVPSVGATFGPAAHKFHLVEFRWTEVERAAA